MRERAERVSPPPHERWVVLASEGEWTHVVDSMGAEVATSTATPYADHIASWPPVVALAVADWLDGVALFVEAKDDEEYFDLDGDPIAPEDTHAIGSALAVTDAYLGGPS